MTKPNNYIVVKTINSIPSLNLFSQASNQNNKPFPDVIDELGNVSLKSRNNNNNEAVKSSDMFKCMRPFLIFGKLVGVVPIGGIFTGNLQELSFRKCSISSFICLSIITILTANTSIAILGYLQSGGRDATQLAKNAAGSVCYGMGLYVFIFIFRNSEGFIVLLRKWRASEMSREYEEKDSKLSFRLNLIAGIILTSAITENAVSHLLLFPLHERTENPLEYYYVNSHKQWATMIPYNPAIAIAVFLCNKWALYAWNFGGIPKTHGIHKSTKRAV